MATRELTKESVTEMTAKLSPPSKNSTFEEAYEYMQTFRPTEDEVRSWVDGTYSDEILIKPERHLFWQGENGRAREERNLPTIVRAYDDGRLIEVFFTKGGMFQNRGSGPAKVYCGKNGEVREVTFCENGETSKLNGPAVMRIYENEHIELVYFLHDEMVEKIILTKESLPKK